MSVHNPLSTNSTSLWLYVYEPTDSYTKQRQILCTAFTHKNPVRCRPGIGRCKYSVQLGFSLRVGSSSPRRLRKVRKPQREHSINLLRRKGSSSLTVLCELCLEFEMTEVNRQKFLHLLNKLNYTRTWRKTSQLENFIINICYLHKDLYSLYLKKFLDWHFCMYGHV